MRLATWLAVVAVAGSLAGCNGSAGAPPSAPSRLLGQPITDFTRPSLSGQRIDTARLRGRVLVVKFFATYCAPCARTLPEAEALHRELGDVVFVGISEDDRASDAEALAQKHQLTFPVIHDAGNVLAGRFRVAEMPATFVVDRSGAVRWVAGEQHSGDDLRAAILQASR
jgi:peroxiredoxin